MNGKDATERNQEIVRLYVEEGFTLREVGERFDLSHEGVRWILKKAGGPVRGVRRPIPQKQQMVGSQEIIRLYVEEGFTLREIATRFDLDPHRLSRVLNKACVSRRKPGTRREPPQHLSP